MKTVVSMMIKTTKKVDKKMYITYYDDVTYLQVWNLQDDPYGAPLWRLIYKIFTTKKDVIKEKEGAAVKPLLQKCSI